MLGSLFNLILYQPLFNILILFYNYLPCRDFGVAVIVLTVFIKILLYPLGVKSIKSQKALAVLQPKIKELQEKYKNDKERQAREMMGLYKREKINPFSGLLPLLIQLPILIALFLVFRTFEDGLSVVELEKLYSFVSQPVINTKFLGIIDLIKPSIVLAFLAGIFQFFQTRMVSSPAGASKKQSAGFSGQIQKQMQYFFPVFTVLILLKMPSAIGLYWATTALFTIVQQYFILKNTNLQTKR